MLMLSHVYQSKKMQEQRWLGKSISLTLHGQEGGQEGKADYPGQPR